MSAKRFAEFLSLLDQARELARHAICEENELLEENRRLHRDLEMATGGEIL